MANRPVPIVLPTQGRTVNDPLRMANTGMNMMQVFAQLAQAKREQEQAQAAEKQRLSLQDLVRQSLTAPGTQQADVPLGSIQEGGQQFSLPQLSQPSQTPQQRFAIEALAQGGKNMSPDVQKALLGLIQPEKADTPNPSWKVVKDANSKTGFAYENLNNPGQRVMEAPEPRAATEITFGKSSPGERKIISEGRSNLGALDNIMSLYDPSYVGQVEGRLGKLKSMTKISKEEASFRSAVKTMAADLKRFYFGTAQTATELRNSIESIPDTNMSDTLFESSMQETRKNVERMLKNTSEVIEQSGLKAPKPGGINVKDLSDAELMELINAE